MMQVILVEPLLDKLDVRYCSEDDILVAPESIVKTLNTTFTETKTFTDYLAYMEQIDAGESVPTEMTKLDEYIGRLGVENDEISEHKGAVYGLC